MDTNRCLACNKEIPGLSRNLIPRKYCNKFCNGRANFQKENPRLGLPTSTVGSISELLVISDLLRSGWYVYRSVTPNSPCDLVASRNEKTVSIEVKTGYRLRGKIINPLIRKTQKFDILATVLLSDSTIIYKPPLP